MTRPIYPDSLGRWMAQVDRQLADLRASQLEHSSVDDGALNFYHAASLRLTIGTQSDGTTLSMDVNADPPPQPTPATIDTSINGGALVSYDGTNDGGEVQPLDWSRTEVHVSGTSGFTAVRATLFTTYDSPNGGTVWIPLAAGTWYFRLAHRNTSGTAGPSSVQTSATTTAQVTRAEYVALEARVTALEGGGSGTYPGASMYPSTTLYPTAA